MKDQNIAVGPYTNYNVTNKVTNSIAIGNRAGYDEPKKPIDNVVVIGDDIIYPDEDSKVIIGDKLWGKHIDPEFKAFLVNNIDNIKRLFGG